MKPQLLLTGITLIGCTGRSPALDTDTIAEPDTDSGTDTAEVNRDTGEDDSIVLTVLSNTDESAVDECDSVCFTAQVTDQDGRALVGLPATIELQGHGFVFDGVSDAGGQIQACPTPVPVGDYEVAFTVGHNDTRHRVLSSATVYPFGYSLSLERPLTALTSIPWVPTFEPYAGNPVFEIGSEESWDSKDAMLPSVVRDGAGLTMLYAGASKVDYEVGVAVSQDGLSWERLSPDAPALSASGIKGSWNRYSANSPMVLLHDGQLEVWYAGREQETSGIAIGRAITEDGVVFLEDSSNPLLAFSEEHSTWEGASLGHPSVVRRDGYVEMWYSTGLHYIGYALSADNGASWQKYCGGPVLGGSRNTWENGQVKSAEVVFNGEYYEMTYSGGGAGSVQVGWAASSDGIRWVKHTTPVLGFGELGTWEGSGTLGASLLIEDSTYRVWYSGVSIAGSQIGYAEAVR